MKHDGKAVGWLYCFYNADWFSSSWTILKRYVLIKKINITGTRTLSAVKAYYVDPHCWQSHCGLIEGSGTRWWPTNNPIVSLGVIQARRKQRVNTDGIVVLTEWADGAGHSIVPQHDQLWKYQHTEAQTRQTRTKTSATCINNLLFLRVEPGKLQVSGGKRASERNKNTPVSQQVQSLKTVHLTSVVTCLFYFTITAVFLKETIRRRSNFTGAHMVC